MIELAPQPRPDHETPRSGWLGWAAAGTAFVAFAALALINSQSGLNGDPRTVNPTPGEPPYPPFLGVTNWPLVTSVTSVLLTLGFFGVVIRWSIRERRPHWALIVGIAALVAGALDPVANWATFTVFDDRTGKRLLRSSTNQSIEGSSGCGVAGSPIRSASPGTRWAR